ncbi:hypothetical protein RB195_022338 [Necator americanus]|uniref:Uncharacterized protein n=1 Tax=Necator americanus TaxID=51031 RepID=A0ABR1EH58_NECAM
MQQPAQVFDDAFDRDPCSLDPKCIPQDRYSDKVNRIAYEGAKHSAKTKVLTRAQVTSTTATAHSILSMDWRTYEERAVVLGKFTRESYNQRRQAFSRASLAQKRRVQPGSIPDGLVWPAN